MSIAVLFPGQGSQEPDMREAVERVRPDLLEAALAEVGEDPFERVSDGTRWAQPAVYCAALAGWSALAPSVRPALLAGHSLGEIAALAAADALHEREGLRLVAARGRLMQEAADAAEPGGLLAVLGRDEGGVVRQVADKHGLTLANDNAPGQVVLAGVRPALRSAGLELEDARLRTRTLEVDGAFHSPAMAPAETPFRAVLEDVPVRPPRVPVLSCVTAEPFGDVRDLLARALTSPVRWREVLLGLQARGARRYLETGPGRVLTGLVKRTVAVHA
jgi:[acyl-carrier-protein] S-malonyltransferase